MNSKLQTITDPLSVNLCGPLCLCGDRYNRNIYHKDTEVSQSSTEFSLIKWLSRIALTTLILFIVAFWLSAPMIAKEARPNEDPQLEQRLKNLTEQLRCPVCQNETLDSSQSEFARQMRDDIREQMKAGKSDEEIKAFLTQRYGDFPLYKPPVKPKTYLLWFGPFVLLIGGTAVLYRYLGRRRQMIEEKPLTVDERKRAEEILRSV